MTVSHTNTWSYEYDLLGHQTSASDPDTGITTSAYDLAGQLKTVTDGRNKQTSYTYDKAGRKTASYDTTGGAAETSLDQTAAWTYDGILTGYPSSSTSYSNGDTIAQTVTGYNVQAQPEGLTTVTGTNAALLPAAGHTANYHYNNVGQIDEEGFPNTAELPRRTDHLRLGPVRQPAHRHLSRRNQRHLRHRRGLRLLHAAVCGRSGASAPCPGRRGGAP